MRLRGVLSAVAVLCIFIQVAEGQSKSGQPGKNDGKWTEIFNGKNLDGWIPKVTGYEAGENPLNLFHIENGILRVDYSRYSRFNGRFGHLFYKDKLSSYILRVEYRFVGELLPDAPAYCYRNSGVMIHSQSPESMEVIQNWPVSLEAQILGSTDSVKQKTASICTPGTYVSYKGIPSNEHCISSASKYYYDGQWVTLDIIVHRSKSVHHVIDGDTVLAYSDPKVGGYLLPENYPVPEGTLLEDGYIALQAEGQNIDFRKVELKILDEPDSGEKIKAKSGKNVQHSTVSIVSKNEKTTLKVIDNFDSYSGDDDLGKSWYQPGLGSVLRRVLEPVIKGGGKYSLKCEYETEKTETGYWSPVCRTGKWDLSGCNGLRFWFKPDGSGREMTFELNIAGKDGKNIHDLWDYVYKCDKGDTDARIVTIPFFSLKHNTKFADSADLSKVFKPEAVIEASIYIGGKNDVPGSGAYYFDEISGTKLQF